MGLDAYFYRTARKDFVKRMKFREKEKDMHALWTKLYEKADVKYNITRDYLMNEHVSFERFAEFRDECILDEEFSKEYKAWKKAYDKLCAEKKKAVRPYEENVECNDSWKVYDFITKFFGKEEHKRYDQEDFNCSIIEIPREKAVELREKYLKGASDKLKTLCNAERKINAYDSKFFGEKNETNVQIEDFIDFRIKLLDEIIKWYDEEDYDPEQYRDNAMDDREMKVIPKSERVIFCEPWY